MSLHGLIRCVEWLVRPHSLHRGEASFVSFPSTSNTGQFNPNGQYKKKHTYLHTHATTSAQVRMFRSPTLTNDFLLAFNYVTRIVTTTKVHRPLLDLACAQRGVLTRHATLSLSREFLIFTFKGFYFLQLMNLILQFGGRVQYAGPI